MIDSNEALMAWLFQCEALENLIGTRIYCGTLPRGYKPEVNGRAITFLNRGGSAEVEVPIISPSVQIECWAPERCHQQAREVYRAIFDWCHGQTNIDLGEKGYILSCVEELQGQDITDPDTQWASVVSYYRLTLRAN